MQHGIHKETSQVEGSCSSLENSPNKTSLWTLDTTLKQASVSASAKAKVAELLQYQKGLHRNGTISGPGC